MVDISKMSETIDKALDTAKAVTTKPVMKVINQRLSNPFFLCFISSWLICNWDRVFLLLFSFSLGMEQRIEKVKAFPSNSVFFGMSIPHTHSFWYPFFASIIFVVGAPFISYVVDIIQNEVLTKKNTNDSKRKKDVLDLKISEINKNVEYEYADAKARLNAEKLNKAIEYSTTAIEEKYNDLQVKLRDVNISIKEKEDELQTQSRTYTNLSNSLSAMRDELDLKAKELMDLNSKIISNQNKLDSIKLEISRNTLPFTNGALNLHSLEGLKNLANSNASEGRVPSVTLANQMINNAISEPMSLQSLKTAEPGMVYVKPNGDGKKNN